jgi:hypothetical protein
LDVNEEFRNEIRYYLRIAIGVALAVLGARFGIKIDPPPAPIQTPVVVIQSPPTPVVASEPKK